MVKNFHKQQKNGKFRKCGGSLQEENEKKMLFSKQRSFSVLFLLDYFVFQKKEKRREGKCV